MARGRRDGRVTRVTADSPGESISGLGRGHGRPARMVFRKTGETPESQRMFAVGAEVRPYPGAEG